LAPWQFHVNLEQLNYQGYLVELCGTNHCSHVSLSMKTFHALARIAQLLWLRCAEWLSESPAFVGKGSPTECELYSIVGFRSSVTGRDSSRGYNCQALAAIPVKRCLCCSQRYDRHPMREKDSIPTSHPSRWKERRKGGTQVQKLVVATVGFQLARPRKSVQHWGPFPMLPT
jgi:hypothetical protein